MLILMRQATCLSHHGRPESRRAGGISCVLIGTIILVTLALVGLSQAAEFACPAGDVACLRAAINAANANGEVNTLTLEAGTYTVTAVDNLSDGANALPSIHSTLTIRRAAPHITVEREVTPSHTPEEFFITRAPPPTMIERTAGAPFFRLFHVAATGSLTLDGLTLAGGNIAGEGGGLLNRGSVVLMQARNSAGGIFGGGGIANLGSGTVVLQNTILALNTAWVRIWC